MKAVSQHSLTIRSYANGDEKGYVALMNTVFPKYNCDIKRWRWEFEENPFGFLQVFGDSESEIVGHMGLIGIPIKLDNTIVQGSQAVDLAVAPQFRGRGMFVEIGRRLMQEAESKGFILSYGVPNEPAYGGHLKYGWFYVSEIPVLAKMVSRKGFVFFALAKLRQLLKRPHLMLISNFMILIRDLTVMTNLRNHAPSGPENFKVRVITSFDAQFDRLWKEVSTEHKCLIVRDEAYLKWRYMERPYSNYVILAVERSARIEGYVVLSTEVRSFRGWKKGYIVDIFARSEANINLLIQLACDYFVEANVDVAICWMMKKQLHYGCLVEHGFVKDTFGSQKLICRINTRDSAFKRLYRGAEREWFFTMGDSDSI